LKVGISEGKDDGLICGDRGQWRGDCAWGTGLGPCWSVIGSSQARVLGAVEGKVVERGRHGDEGREDDSSSEEN
jgi:hypothetical protein